MARLVAVKGAPSVHPEASSPPDNEYTLAETAVIGRSSDADIRVNDPAVSRRHARLALTASGYVIVDLGSSNGTKVNGERVYTPKPLRDGDLIQIAESVFSFAETTQPPPPPSQGDGPSREEHVEDERERESTITASVDLLSPTSPDHVTADTAALRKATMRLKTILGISNTIQAELDLPTVLDEIMNGIFRVFPQADRGCIMLRDPAMDRLIPSVMRSRAGGDAAIPGHDRVVVSSHIRDEVARKRVGVLIADAMGDGRFSRAESVMKLHIRSVMCVPLVADDELLGLIHIDTLNPGSAFTRDDLDMITGVANQAALAIAGANLHRRLMDQQRLERDLQLAQQVQLSFLPDHTPQVNGMRFCVSYRTAMKVGGDFYDFIPLRDDRLAIVVGDVSGKGMPAALLMARMTSDVRFLSVSEREPCDVLKALNGRLADRISDDSFVTLVFILLDAPKGKLVIANAGHLPPVISGSEPGNVRRIDRQIGFPLGVDPRADYLQEETMIGQGDTVSIFTDGVTEAMNGQHESYGEERLVKVIADGASEPMALMKRALDDLHKHVGDNQPSDDLTFVCFGRVP